MTFIRMQEWYECPDEEFKNKYFTLERYMDWYVKERDPCGGRFIYARDWSAFNVPKRAVEAVFRDFLPHSEKERWLFSELAKENVFGSENYYLIGSRVGKRTHFEHEYRHAVFTLDPDYKKAILRVVRRHEIPELKAWLRERYAEEVVEDEIQAYALTGWPRKLKVLTDEMRDLKCALKKVEASYLKP